MSDIPLPAAGVDNRTEHTAMRAGSVREARNLLLHPSGVFARRDGYATAVAGEDFRSIHAGRHGVTVARGSVLYDCRPADCALTPLYDTGVDAPVCCAEYNGLTYILTQRELLVRDAAGVRRAGVDAPAVLPTLADAPGSLPPGVYGVAVSALVAGEESGAVWCGTVRSTGGVRVTGLAGAHRIYLTTADGDTLYHALDGDGDAHLAFVPAGGPCATLHMQRLPGGHLVRGWNGRLYVACGNVLCFSQPLRPHLFDPGGDFILFDGDIRVLETAPDGLYVGDERGVWFLAGDDPQNARLTLADARPAVPGSGVAVTATEFGGQANAGTLALWLTAAGYVLGNGDGATTPVQGARIALAGGLRGASRVITQRGVTQALTLTRAYDPVSIPSPRLFN